MSEGSVSEGGNVAASSQEIKAPSADVQGVKGNSEAQSQGSQDTQKAPVRESTQAEKYRIKVDGQELEVDIEELKRGYQLKQASHKKFQEAAEKEKQAGQIMQALESGDLNFIVSKLGPQKARALMEDYLIEQIQYENLPEAERRAIDAERRLKQFEQERQQEQQRLQQQEQERVMAQAHAELDREVGEALKELGRKPTPRLVIRIVDEMIARMDAKDQRITAKDAVKYAQKGILTDLSEYLPQLSDEELFQTIPKEVWERMRKHDVNRVTQASTQRRPKSSGNQPKNTKPKRIGMDDYFKQLDAKFG